MALSKPKENSTSADGAKAQGWSHLYHEAVALWWNLDEICVQIPVTPQLRI